METSPFAPATANLFTYENKNQCHLITKIPECICALNRWVLSDSEKRPRCVDDPNRFASPTDPFTWGSYTDALDVFQRNQFLVEITGLGFVLNGDGIVCIDLDDCRNPDTEEIDPVVWDEVQAIGSYTEISQSGTGLHIFCRGYVPENGKRKQGVEVYSAGRYIVVTGNVIPGLDTLRDVDLTGFWNKHFAVEQTPIKPFCDPLKVPLSDEALITKAESASNGEIFKRLFNGDISGYDNDDSRADQALCDIIAFYTKDIQQIDRIFRQSKLYRPKWDDARGSQTYGQMTILAALNRVTDCYNPRYHPDTDEALTDLWNARRFTADNGDDVRYCAATRKWYIWNGFYWCPDVTAKIMELAKDTVKGIYYLAYQEEDRHRREELGKHALRSQALHKIKDMVELAQSEPEIAIRRDEFDSNPDLFNVINGTIDLSNLTFKEPRKEDLLTKTSAVTYSADADCPLWKDHIRFVLNSDDNLIDTFQMICGYSLLATNPDQLFFILTGPGKNGKSVTLDVIREIMGDYARTVSPKSLMVKNGEGPRNDIARLVGSRAVFSVEGDNGNKLAEALIKQLTGGDVMTCRLLYKEEFEYKPGMKFFFATNHLPEIWGTDNAIWRRIRVIPFNVTISEERRDKNIISKLLAERSGIFNWMLEGLRMYWDAGAIKEAKRIREATAEYQEDMDIIGPFLKDCCKIEQGAVIGRNELYNRYLIYCSENGVNNLSGKTFANKLKERGIQKAPNSGNVRRWTGVRLLTEGEMLKRTDTLDAFDASFLETSSITPPIEEFPESVYQCVSSASTVSSTTLEELCRDIEIGTLPDLTQYTRIREDKIGYCMIKGCKEPKAWENHQGLFFLCDHHYLAVKQLIQKGI